MIALRDTGSTTCVVKTDLVKPEQMTGSYELRMLIDGVVKRFPMATIEIDTPFCKGCAKVLCTDSPVQEVIIGNIPGAVGLRQHCGSRVKATNLCTDELRQIEV